MGSDPRKIRQHQELTVVKAISKAIDVKYPPVVDSPLIPKAPDEGEYRRLVSEYIRGSSSSSEGASAENGANCRPVSGIVGGFGAIGGSGAVGGFGAVGGSGAVGGPAVAVGVSGVDCRPTAMVGGSGAIGGTGIGGGVENCGGPGTSGASEGPMFPEGVSWGNAWEVLVKFLGSEFSDVRRLSASALGKLAPSSPPHQVVLPRLMDLAENDPKPQVCQYAVKSVGRYAEFAFDFLDRLKDVARDESAPGYVRTAAAEVVASVQERHRSFVARNNHFCARCKRIVTEPEYRRGMARWGKPYCRHCFDEKSLEDRNFEAKVEDAKKRRSELGTAVQSRGEKLIADFLESEHIEYRYDARYMIAGDVRIRPDFYLPEFDVYIEYFGMNTPEYRDDMLKKRLLYQRAGKKLVSVSYKDADPVSVLRRKLSRYFRI